MSGKNSWLEFPRLQCFASGNADLKKKYTQKKCQNNGWSTSLVAWWSELLTTNHEVPGSIPGSTMCVFP